MRAMLVLLRIPVNATEFHAGATRARTRAKKARLTHGTFSGEI